MTRPIEAVVHTDSLAANLGRARRAAAGARVWAVVKANAYGHGIANVFTGLRDADGFALLDIAEAELLRGLGWRGPILLLEGCFGPRDLDACSRLGLWHVVHHAAQIDMLAAHKTQAPHRVFLKMNSGMNRLGFAPQSTRAAWLRLDALDQVDGITLMTHLAAAEEPVDAAPEADEPVEADRWGEATGPTDDTADVEARARADAGAGAGAGADPDGDADGHAATTPAAAAHAAARAVPPGVRAQMAVFDAASAELPGERSICNSAATLRFAAHHASIRGDWVRPGILLYGSSPDHPRHSAADWNLLPAMSLRSRLIACQDLVAGDRIGYGGGYRAERAMRIGVVACGYADGYPRVVPTSSAAGDAGTPVLVDGVRTRIVGRVSMDMVTVDLTSLPSAHVGSEVTLWGRASDGAVLPIDEIARLAGTVGYELMCARAARVPTRVAA